MPQLQQSECVEISVADPYKANIYVVEVLINENYDNLKDFVGEYITEKLEELDKEKEEELEM